MSNPFYLSNSIETEIKKRKKKSKNLAVKNQKKGKIVKEADPLVLYFKQISRFPLLTVHEEQIIGEKIVSLREKLAQLEAEKNKKSEEDYKNEKNVLDNTLLH